MKRFSFFILILGLSFGLAASTMAQEDDTQTAGEESQAAAPAPSESVPAPQDPQASADAQKQPVPLRVIDIEIRGNQIVSTATILSKIKSQKGETLVQETMNEDLKRLYATNFFQDIRIEIEEQGGGYKLIINVEEKPIVKQVVIEGNTVFKEDKLRKTLKIVEGQILDRRAVKQGIEEVRKLYGDKGFRFVDVKSDVDINPVSKEATVRIKVLEGEKFKIKSIQFDGVKAFKEKQIRKLMKTKPRKLFSSGVFKESNFQKDLEKIRLFYQQEGYLDVKVDPRFDYDKTNKKIIITLAIEEGQHYVTGDVQIRGNEVFPESEIWQELEMLPGLTYSQYYLFKDVERIRNYYFNHGYIEARVIPDVKLNRDSGKVDVTHQIQEGDLFFVEKVMVRGNTKTKDIVIRRELRIRPGEKFDGDKIEKSKERLKNLGYFEDVTYDTEPVADTTNRKNVIFRVKEKRTGEISFGGGISSVDRFVGFAEVAQHNFDFWNWPRFTGGGQNLSVRARVGSYSQDYTVNFTEPYLFNKPISWGTELFNTYRDDKNVAFNQKRLGFTETLSKLFFDVWRLGTGYTLERATVYDLASDAPDSVKVWDGKSWLSRARLFNTYDTRDNVFNPSRGLVASASGELVGSFLGGNEDYYTLEASVTKYWSFFKKHLLETRLQFGTSSEFSSTPSVPIYDRFYAGGLGSVRGFDYRRVGPQENGYAVGGQTLMLANIEYTVPIPYLDAFRAAVFVDAGSVNKDSYDLSFSHIAVSTGPGIKIKTPIGPIALYYGLPIANRDMTKNRGGKFEFSLSRGF